MRAVRLESVKVGDILGTSLFNEKSELMLAAGYELTDETIRLLKEHGFRQLYILDDSLPDYKPLEVVSETVRKSVARRMNSTFGEVELRLAKLPQSPIQLRKRLTEDNSLLNILPMTKIGESVNTLIDELLMRNISILSAIAVKSSSGRLYQHAIDTALLAILIGQQFKYELNELRALGTSALLHDIGKMALGRLYEKKRGTLNFQERWLLREHPTYSMLILKGSDPHSYMEQSTVLQHHERPDGRGYPQGMRGLNVAPLKAKAAEPGYIFRHAEILTVANAYDNLVSGEEDGTAHAPQNAVSIMVTQAGRGFNPHILRALTRVVQFYPTGSEVRILNTFSGEHIGYRGIVKEANPVEYAKPVLLVTHDDEDNPITPFELDLRTERVAYLELVL